MLTRTSLTIRLNPNDDVVIARTQLVGGTLLTDENVTVSGLVPPGHKVATRAIRAGAPVRRYNQIIGFASRDIAPGEHVHLNNLAMGAFERDYAFGVDVKPTRYVDPPATFMGIVRARRARRDAQLHRPAVDGQLLGDRRARHRRRTSAATRSRRVPERRRRRRADARLGLRDGHARRRHDAAAAHAGRLCAARELRRRARRRPGLRGEPDQRAVRRART